MPVYPPVLGDGQRILKALSELLATSIQGEAYLLSKGLCGENPLQLLSGKRWVRNMTARAPSSLMKGFSSLKPGNLEHSPNGGRRGAQRAGGFRD